MKKLFILISLLSFNLFANTKSEGIYLSYCSHYGTGVSYSFQSCANSNFSSVSFKLGGYLSNCSNYGTEVDYSFVSCINSNFQEIERKLNNEIYLSYCSNYDRSSLEYAFVSCVNNNFRQIEYKIP
jgi:hypothetical protein